jgi:hypothetical protein
MSNQKPEQFWIDSILNVDNPSVKSAYIYEQDTEKFRGNAIHVIEYSAYEELQKKLDLAIEALEEASEYHNTDDVNGEAGYICWKAIRRIVHE